MAQQMLGEQDRIPPEVKEKLLRQQKLRTQQLKQLLQQKQQRKLQHQKQHPQQHQQKQQSLQQPPLQQQSPQQQSLQQQSPQQQSQQQQSPQQQSPQQQSPQQQSPQQQSQQQQSQQQQSVQQRMRRLSLQQQSPQQSPQQQSPQQQSQQQQSQQQQLQQQQSVQQRMRRLSPQQQSPQQSPQQQSQQQQSQQQQSQRQQSVQQRMRRLSEQQQSPQQSPQQQSPQQQSPQQQSLQQQPLQQQLLQQQPVQKEILSAQPASRAPSDVYVRLCRLHLDTGAPLKDPTSLETLPGQLLRFRVSLFTDKWLRVNTIEVTFFSKARCLCPIRQPGMEAFWFEERTFTSTSTSLLKTPLQVKIIGGQVDRPVWCLSREVFFRLPHTNVCDNWLYKEDDIQYNGENSIEVRVEYQECRTCVRGLQILEEKEEEVVWDHTYVKIRSCPIVDFYLLRHDMGLLIIFRFGLTLLMLISTACGQQADIVTTTLGRIQGLRKTVNGKTVDVYYGIPFAEPPVGELRFKRPVPAEPWTDVRSTITKPNACYQMIDTAFDRFPGVEMWNPNTPMSEDCLYLNVWVPRQSGSKSPLTTMVWIYGGGFTTGSSALDVYDGSKLAVSQNVIVASLNYRVGPLGFLYTGTTNAPGNQGLLDQSLALKWIYDNVVSFGGRQDNITIFGESAGAFSVGLHVLSPMSNNHFSRAIMESGSPFQRTLFMSDVMGKKRAQKLATTLQCPDHPNSAMLHCLRTVSAQSVTDNQYAVTSDLYTDTPLRAVVDGYFLPDTPARLVGQGTVNKTEILIGINENEGFYFLLYSFPKLFPLQPTSNISDTQFKELMRALSFHGKRTVTEALTYEYKDKVVPANRPSYRDIADDVCGDYIISCPTLDFARTFAALETGHDVYLYSFEHNLSNNPWPDYMGVMHGYEIEAVFGLPRPYNYTQAELDLADRMMGYWTRFAKTGNPNSGGAALWPKLTTQEARYLALRAQGDRVGQGLRRQHCSFVTTILPLL